MEGLMKKLVFPVILILVGSLLLSACGVINDVGLVTKAGNDFMTGLRDGNHQLTWGILTTALQTELGGYDSWIQFATPRNFDKWSFSNTQVVNAEAQIDGECSIGADTYTLRLVFAKVGSDWKVSGINLTAK